MATESPQKHFIRWNSHKLSPAALVSERPFALAVARVIAGAETPPPVLDECGHEVLCNSKAHGNENFCTSEHEPFVKANLVGVQEGEGNNVDGHVDCVGFSAKAKESVGGSRVHPNEC